MKVVIITRNYVASGKLFKVNQQFALQDEVLKAQSCGCAAGTSIKVKYYRINLDGKVYDIHKDVAVVQERTSVEEIISPNDFYYTLHGTTIKDNRNYDLIRNKPDIGAILDKVNNINM